jgi:Domain of unknown function (DUF397)
MFRKSSFSPVEGGGGPACVEVARTGEDILVRDSKDPSAVLRFSSAEWQAFIEGVKAQEFDV